MQEKLGKFWPRKETVEKVTFSLVKPEHHNEGKFSHESVCIVLLKKRQSNWTQVWMRCANVLVCKWIWWCVQGSQTFEVVVEPFGLLGADMACPPPRIGIARRPLQHPVPATFSSRVLGPGNPRSSSVWVHLPYINWFLWNALRTNRSEGLSDIGGPWSLARSLQDKKVTRDIRTQEEMKAKGEKMSWMVNVLYAVADGPSAPNEGERRFPCLVVRARE